MDDPVLIVLVEDQFAIRELLVGALEDAGYAVAAASTGEDTIALVERGHRNAAP